MKRLYRSRRNKILGGVAAGLAEYFSVDITLMRLAFAFMGIIVPHIMILGYILAWVIIPEEPASSLAKTDSKDSQRAGGLSTVPTGFKDDGSGSQEPPTGTGDQPMTANEILARSGVASEGETPGGDQAQDERTAPPSQPSTTDKKQLSEGKNENSHRSSQFFGFILVAIGAILLLKRIIPPVFFAFPSYAIRTWWPLALVVVGLIIIVTAFRRD